MGPCSRTGCARGHHGPSQTVATAVSVGGRTGPPSVSLSGEVEQRERAAENHCTLSGDLRESQPTGHGAPRPCLTPCTLVNLSAIPGDGFLTLVLQKSGVVLRQDHRPAGRGGARLSQAVPLSSRHVAGPVLISSGLQREAAPQAVPAADPTFEGGQRRLCLLPLDSAPSSCSSVTFRPSWPLCPRDPLLKCRRGQGDPHLAFARVLCNHHWQEAGRGRGQAVFPGVRSSVCALPPQLRTNLTHSFTVSLVAEEGVDVG